MPGRRWPGRAATARLSSSRMARAWARPSMIRAGTGLSLLRQLQNFDRPGDLDGEGGQVRQRGTFGDADRHLDHPRLLQDGHRDSFGDRFEELGRLSLEDLAGDSLDNRVA